MFEFGVNSLSAKDRVMDRILTVSLSFAKSSKESITKWVTFCVW